jgi:hypothetical protein
MKRLLVENEKQAIDKKKKKPCKKSNLAHYIYILQD